MSKPRLLPSHGGRLCLAGAIEHSEPGDYFVVALSSEPENVDELAEYTHCGDVFQAAQALDRYRSLWECSDAFVLVRLPSDKGDSEEDETRG